MTDVTVPAGPYAANSMFDALSIVGYVTTVGATWSPSGATVSVGADGIPYMTTPANGRQTTTYFETDGAGHYVSVPAAGDGHTALYVINDSVPLLGIVPTQLWAAGIDSSADLDITDADDPLSTLVITGALPAGVSVVLHTYLPGDPGEFQKWRLEFSLPAGSGVGSGTISNLTVTDTVGAASVFPPFDWVRTDGVQVPAPGALYTDYVAQLIAVGLSPSQATQIPSELPDGTVISTDPAYPAYVSAGSLIEITVASNPVAIVPTLVGLLPVAGVVLLTDAGLVLGLQASGYSDQYAAGLISDQSPIAGTGVEPGTGVDITVSLGPRPFVPPPTAPKNRRPISLRKFLTG